MNRKAAGIMPTAFLLLFIFTAIVAAEGDPAEFGDKSAFAQGERTVSAHYNMISKDCSESGKRIYNAPCEKQVAVRGHGLRKRVIVGCKEYPAITF